jgi:hypothetical protein
MLSYVLSKLIGNIFFCGKLSPDRNYLKVPIFWNSKIRINSKATALLPLITSKRRIRNEAMV